MDTTTLYGSRINLIHRAIKNALDTKNNYEDNITKTKEKKTSQYKEKIKSLEDKMKKALAKADLYYKNLYSVSIASAKVYQDEEERKKEEERIELEEEAKRKKEENNIRSTAVSIVETHNILIEKEKQRVVE